MKTIWKFPLDPFDPALKMPQGAVVLSAAAQGHDVCVWALVDTDAPRARRRFRVYGTGHPLPDEVGVHVGTALLPSGLVFHVFDEGEEAA